MRSLEIGIKTNEKIQHFLRFYSCWLHFQGYRDFWSTLLAFSMTSVTKISLIPFNETPKKEP